MVSAQFAGRVGGLTPSGASRPQVFIDPRKNSQKCIADLPLVLPQIEYCGYTMACTS